MRNLSLTIIWHANVVNLVFYQSIAASLGQNKGIFLSTIPYNELASIFSWQGATDKTFHIE